MFKKSFVALLVIAMAAMVQARTGDPNEPQAIGVMDCHEGQVCRFVIQGLEPEGRGLTYELYSGPRGVIIGEPYTWDPPAEYISELIPDAAYWRCVITWPTQWGRPGMYDLVFKICIEGIEEKVCTFVVFKITVKEREPLPVILPVTEYSASDPTS